MEIYDDLETDDKASVSVIDYENALRARPQVYERVAMAELGTIEEACSLAEKYEDILGETYDGSRHYNDQIRRNNYTSIVPRNERYSYNANFNNDVVNNYELINDLLYFKNRIVIPKALRNSIILRYHSTPSAGHFSTCKTEELISRFYFWPNLHEDVDEFVKQCLECATLKDKSHAPYGLSQISFTPKRPWTHINVDFITDLPPSA